jgi:hypothetical protein
MNWRRWTLRTDIIKYGRCTFVVRRKGLGDSTQEGNKHIKSQAHDSYNHVSTVKSPQWSSSGKSFQGAGGSTAANKSAGAANSAKRLLSKHETRAREKMVSRTGPFPASGRSRRGRVNNNQSEGNAEDNCTAHRLDDVFVWIPKLSWLWVKIAC